MDPRVQVSLIVMASVVVLISIGLAIWAKGWFAVRKERRERNALVHAVTDGSDTDTADANKAPKELDALVHLEAQHPEQSLDDAVTRQEVMTEVAEMTEVTEVAAAAHDSETRGETLPAIATHTTQPQKATTAALESAVKMMCDTTTTTTTTAAAAAASVVSDHGQDEGRNGPGAFYCEGVEAGVDVAEQERGQGQGRAGTAELHVAAIEGCLRQQGLAGADGVQGPATDAFPDAAAADVAAAVATVGLPGNPVGDDAAAGEDGTVIAAAPVGEKKIPMAAASDGNDGNNTNDAAVVAEAAPFGLPRQGRSHASARGADRTSRIRSTRSRSRSRSGMGEPGNTRRNAVIGGGAVEASWCSGNYATPPRDPSVRTTRSVTSVAGGKRVVLVRRGDTDGSARGGSGSGEHEGEDGGEAPPEGDQEWFSDMKWAFVENVAHAWGAASAEMRLAVRCSLSPTSPSLARGPALGKGKFGTVIRVLHDGLGPFALKEVSQEAGQKGRNAALAEMSIFVRLKFHPNIIAVKAIDNTIPTMPILMEEACCDMFDVLSDGADHSTHMKIRLLVDAARGLQHMHENGMVHVDVKPDNILVVRNLQNGRFEGKVADVGLTRAIGSYRGKMTGTNGFIPVENLFDSVSAAPDQDAFAVGVLVLMTFVIPELQAGNMFAVEELLNDVELAWLENIYLDEDCVDPAREVAFHCQVMARTSKDGSFAREMLVPENLQEGVPSRDKVCEWLKACLSPDPSVRLSVEELMHNLVDLAEQARRMPQSPRPNFTPRLATALVDSEQATTENC